MRQPCLGLLGCVSSMESPQQDPRVGVVLSGRYRITELLGEGGMGRVYRGERLQLGRPVAIKFLHSPFANAPKYMQRFEREARAMSKLSHPYCVSVIDFGVHDEPYIVMDFVTGQTLRELMDRGRLSPQRAVHITRQVLAGLAHAHGQGVIHRDVKPGNVMVSDATGVGDHVRIFDFGLAKLHDPGVEPDQSMATVIGTPAYMAPEQTRAEAIDGRADLYAVGILLFELLTGDKPFVGDDAIAVIRMQRDMPPPLLRTRAPELSVELEQVVAKALEKDPLQRYQSAAEFAAALDTAPEAHVRASLPREELISRPLEAQVSPRARRRALLGLALVTAVGAFVFLRTRPDAQPVVRSPEARAGAAQPAEIAPAPPAAASPRALPAPYATSERDAATAALSPADQAALAPARPPLTSDDEELSDAELAAADEALDVTGELEAQPVAASSPDVRSISEVHALIDGGHLDAAIFGLKRLRKQSPNNPYMPYLLGDLYFERGWWSDGLAKYREAIRLSDGYRKRSTIHKNAIQALGSSPTYAKARALLMRDLGRAALPALDQAASQGSSPLIQKRARSIAAQLRRAR
jgi:eukaryotic-like serine/threonine-protein kinase